MKKPNFLTRNSGLLLAILFGTAVVFVITQYETVGDIQATEPPAGNITANTTTAEAEEDGTEKGVMDYLRDYGYTKGRPAIIDMYATWCGPCMKMAPHIKAIAESYKESLQVIQVDIDQDEEFARAAGIEAVPTLIIIDMDGNMEKSVGAMSEEELTALAEALTRKQ